MLIFEWDLKKAKTNLEKHGVSFEEASTAFKDTLSLTIDDPLHSSDEKRLVLIGMSYNNRILVVVHTERGDNIRRLLVPEKQQKKKGNIMKIMSNDPDMLEEYDFSKGVRGKYAKKYKKGTNVVFIDPEVAEFFPDENSVNEALRSLIPIIKKREKRIAEQGH